MEIAFKLFVGLSTIAGAAALIAFVGWLFGLAVTQLWRMCKVYNVLALCTAVWVRGRDYRDDLFWRAVLERVESSRFEAKKIAEFAYRHAPKEGPEEL